MMAIRWVLCIAIFSMTAGCQRSAQGGSKAAASPKALSAEGYMKLGIPAPDRVWSPTDFTRAVKALAAIPAEDHRLLPRYGANGASGTVFKRLTDPENWAILKNDSLPIAQRMPMTFEALPASKQLVLTYMNAHPKDPSRGAELVEVAASNLVLMGVLVDLTQAFSRTLDPKDPTYATRMAGLEKMYQGAALSVSGVLTTFSETKAYATPDLVRLAGHLETILPPLLKTLPPSARLESTVRIDGLLKTNLPAPLKAALKTLKQTLKA